MSRKEKLLLRFLSQPKDFTFNEAVRLLNDFDFYEVRAGKTSGSRVRFENEALQAVLRLHKPHPGNILKPYQLDDIKRVLINCNLIEQGGEDENDR